MNEMAPGIVRWTATHPSIGRHVSSYMSSDAGTLADLLLAHGEPLVGSGRAALRGLVQRTE